MSKPDTTQTTVETGKQQSEAYHTMAFASEAIPRTEDLLEALLTCDQAAEQGDPDLEELAVHFRTAEQQYRNLRKRAEFLASTQDQ